MKEKSILEQALLQIDTLEEAVKQNAKGILESTMKQEIRDLLKESKKKGKKVVKDIDLDEQEEEDEDEIPSKGIDNLDNEDMDSDDEDMDDDEEDMDDDEEDMDDDEEDMDDDEEDMDDDEEDMDYDEEDMDDDEEDDEFEGGGLDNFNMGDEDSELDLSNSSDSEVIKVFKSLSPDDQISVTKDDEGNLELKDGENEYYIKLNENRMRKPKSKIYESYDTMEDIFGDDGYNDSDSYGDDEELNEYDETDEDVVYEIDLDEYDETETETEMREASRTKSNPHGNKNGMSRSGLPSKKTYKAGSGVYGLNEDVVKLKKQNNEYKKALKLFKEKLNEVAVFNASLAYSTRLFTENTTTKQEKLNILKRFDSVSTINESKNLYNTIKNELVSKSPITESVVTKLTNTPTSSSKDMLSESKAYENPQFRRMRDLMSKLK